MPTALQNEALDRLAEFEGGFVNDPADRGGATKYGITLGFLRSAGEDINGDGVIDVRDVHALTPARARDLYLKHFWPAWLDALPRQIALQAFDLGVNAGLGRAARVLQEALNAVGLYPFAQDGKVGPKTLAAIEHLRLLGQAKQEACHLAYMRLRADFYIRLALDDQTQLRFIRGWIRRTLS